MRLAEQRHRRELPRDRVLRATVRVGADGQPRPLHVKEALAAMDLSLPPPVPSDAVDCPYFTFRMVAAGALPAEPAERVVYVPATGETLLLAPGESVVLADQAFVSVVK